MTLYCTKNLYPCWDSPGIGYPPNYHPRNRPDPGVLTIFHAGYLDTRFTTGYPSTRVPRVPGERPTNIVLLYSIGGNPSMVPCDHGLVGHESAASAQSINRSKIKKRFHIVVVPLAPFPRDISSILYTRSRWD